MENSSLCHSFPFFSKEHEEKAGHITLFVGQRYVFLVCSETISIHRKCDRSIHLFFLQFEMVSVTGEHGNSRLPESQISLLV